MLYPHQQEMRDFILSGSRRLVISPMGAGKTRAVLAAITRDALVVAPLRVASMVWPDEARAVGIDCVYMSSGGGAPRVSRSNFYATNFENPCLLAGTIPPGVKTLIIDESSKLKGFQLRGGAKRAKALYQLAKRCERVILLTGTSCSESLGDLYSQITFLDGGRTFGASKFAFMVQYHVNVSHTPKFPIWRPVTGAFDAVACRAVDFVKYFEPTLETFGHVDDTIFVPATRAQTLTMHRMAEGKIAKLEGKTVYACNSAVLAQRMLQLASGIAYTEEGDTLTLSDEKIDILRGILDDNPGDRFVIVAYWRASLDAIAKAFPDEVTTDIATFKADKIKHLLISPAGAAHGLSLQHQSCHMIMYEPFFSCEQYEQVLERIGERRQAQAGLNRVVFYHYFECGEVEGAAWRALRTKADIEAEIIQLIERARCLPTTS